MTPWELSVVHGLINLSDLEGEIGSNKTVIQKRLVEIIFKSAELPIDNLDVIYSFMESGWISEDYYPKLMLRVAQNTRRDIVENFLNRNYSENNKLASDVRAMLEAFFPVFKKDDFYQAFSEAGEETQESIINALDSVSLNSLLSKIFQSLRSSGLNDNIIKFTNVFFKFKGDDIQEDEIKIFVSKLPCLIEHLDNPERNDIVFIDLVLQELKQHPDFIPEDAWDILKEIKTACKNLLEIREEESSEDAYSDVSDQQIEEVLKKLEDIFQVTSSPGLKF